jgi:hypothetical protein
MGRRGGEREERRGRRGERERERRREEKSLNTFKIQILFSKFKANYSIRTIRYLKKDETTFLPYAQENMFAYVLYWRIPKTTAADSELKVCLKKNRKSSELTKHERPSFKSLQYKTFTNRYGKYKLTLLVLILKETHNSKLNRYSKYKLTFLVINIKVNYS